MSLKTFKNYSYYDINEILTSSEINKLPYTIRILLENMARVKDFGLGTQTDIDNVSKWSPKLISKKVKNLFFTGQLTVPGPGVPPSLISGKLVSKLINNSIPLN